MKILSVLGFTGMLLLADNIQAGNELSIQEHKKLFLEALKNDPKIHQEGYQYDRTVSSIEFTDADEIPKVPNAGEIISQGDLECQIMHNGIKIVKDCYYDVIWNTDIIYALRGHHEPQEEKMFYEVLKYIPENAVMIELGSYWAYYSLWFNQEIKGAVNYMIEPSKERLNVGRKNFLINKKKGHFILGYAGNAYDEAWLFDKKARCIQIDNFLKEKKIEKLHILHADIQFAEFEMLRTCTESIKEEKIDFFFISTHSDNLHDACVAFFLEHDLEILAQHYPAYHHWGDGLIVAQRKGIPGPGYIEVSQYRR